VEGGLLLDVVVGEGPSVLELLASEDQPLLVWGDALLVLDLGLDVLDRVGWLNLEGDGLTSEGLDEDLHSSSQTKHKMKSALLLDVVIRQSSAILQLFTGKDQPLLVWGNSLLILDLGLHIFNSVRRFDLQSYGLSCEGLHKDLHTSTETKYEMKSTFLLDVIIGKSSAIL